MQLLTWNTQWCRGVDGRVSPQRIVQGARALGDFDVLCLQEIAQGFGAMPGAPGDQPAELQALLPGFRVFFGAALDAFAADGRPQRFGNLVATRLPVAQVQHHPLPWPADPAVPSMPRMATVLTVVDPRLGAVRIVTTHLEYYSALQRMAQVRALRALHAEACDRAAAPPQPAEWEDAGEAEARADGSAARPVAAASPFAAWPQTRSAVVCGDFNFAPGTPEYGEMTQPRGGVRLHDAWTQVHGPAPQPPTFRVFDRSQSPGAAPSACDLVFLSDDLAPRVRAMRIDLQTQASDHQPVWVEL